jgi:hypothetical protein
MPEQPKHDEDLSKDFLLAELGMMEEEIKRLRTEGLARLQFLFSITSALLAGLLALAGLTTLSEETVRQAAVAACLLLFAFSLATFEYLIGHDISSDRNARGTARIRRYFLDRSAALAQHVSWQVTDAPTQWVSADLSTNRRMVALIACAMIGLASGICYFQFIGGAPESYYSGLVVALATANRLKRWSTRRLAAAFERAKADQRFHSAHMPPVHEVSSAKKRLKQGERRTDEASKVGAESESSV